MEGTSIARQALGTLGLLALLSWAAALGGCSEFHGTTAASFLRNIRENPDPNVRYDSYAKLASSNCYDSPEGKVEATRLLVAKLDEGREPVATRAVICRTLGELRHPGARDAIAKAVGDPEAIVRVQACRALGKVGRPEDATILARIMATDILDCRVAAIEGLGELKSTDPRIIEVLVTGMDHDDPAIRLASLNALRSTTGKDLGVDPAPWRKLLEAQVAAKTDPPASSGRPAADAAAAKASAIR